MNDAGLEKEPEHHGPFKAIVDRIHRHHERVMREREEEELAEAARHAAFDLEADIGHPRMRRGDEPFDMDEDLGAGHRPRDP
ncbi:hypothetical protein [Nonomuraea basaltis]|uniref:hypothetical protein n=1 Tax=Nonomuraea basaltis TaxID=2495887 RepID=UPI00110C6835|nr:hypothetical protein [Nonomuraea basaltis]TMR96143.1 hypothetical protein EJK15_24730 [Nonomuraea basaltis]